eukprot:1003115-Heterocapsa_arctica.AAC.1
MAPEIIAPKVDLTIEEIRDLARTEVVMIHDLETQLSDLETQLSARHATLLFLRRAARVIHMA